MPQSARKDAAAQRAQDKESKRARGAMSCAECRRLKLKCDKSVPCASCVRRGCSAICPNGSLITGQGTRFVLADTEKLHQKISRMSDRIRHLEDALAISHKTVSEEQHPLLTRDLLSIKSSIELHSATENPEDSVTPEEGEESRLEDGFGTLAIRDDGAATFYGRSAGSESLLIGESEKAPQVSSPSQGPSHKWRPHLPKTIAELSGAFPLASGGLGEIDLDYLVESFLPPWNEAWRLCEGYLEQAPWFFGAVTKRQLHEEVLPMWYSEAKTGNLPGVRVSDVNATPTQGGAHELALIFVIFCFGALTDISLPPAPDNPDSDHYYLLTRAALTLEPVLERPPSVSTVQALSLMAIYQGLCAGENSIESTWALMGMAAKLAQSIGLHRDCARWKLTPSEVQKRRALFWELFITDCWQSLATGRLPTFALPFVDTELPGDPDQTIADDGTIVPSFPFWKARFGEECVSAVAQGTLTSRAPKYSTILELDRKIRDMELPKYAQGPTPQGLGFAQTMAHFMPINYRELTLLYVHRCFFAHAISSHPTDPIKSPYAPSFLAGYRSACELIGSLKEQFSLFPAQIARYWVLWTHAFSSAVMLASVVTHGSKSKVAPAALLELRSACDLFERAAGYGGRAVKFLPIIQRLQEKAHRIYIEAHSGIPHLGKNDIFTPSQPQEIKDEFSIFSGGTHTIATKSAASVARGHRKPSSSSGGSTPKSPSDASPPLNFTTVPSFAGAHPSLADQLQYFDVHLHSQIQNAYNVNHDAFARTIMESQPFYRPCPPPLPPQVQQHQHQHQNQTQQQQAHQQSLQQHRQPSHIQVPPPQPQHPQQLPQHQTQVQYQQHQEGQQHQLIPTTAYQTHPSMHVQYTQNQTSTYSAVTNHPPPLVPQHQQHHHNAMPPYHQQTPSQQQQQHQSHHSPLYTHSGSHHTSPDPSPSDSRPHTGSQGGPEVTPPPYWPMDYAQTHAQTVGGHTNQFSQGVGAQQQQQQQHYANGMGLGIGGGVTVGNGGGQVEDPRLQETWTTFMYQVGSPRRFMVDD